MPITYHRLNLPEDSPYLTDGQMECQIACGDGEGGAIAQGPTFILRRTDVLKVSDPVARGALPSDWMDLLPDDPAPPVDVDLDAIIAEFLENL